VHLLSDQLLGWSFLSITQEEHTTPIRLGLLNFEETTHLHFKLC
jgi:hypothetical protein